MVTARHRQQQLTASMMFGMLPSLATTCSRETASTFPTMSQMSVGRYFSTCTRYTLSSAKTTHGQKHPTRYWQAAAMQSL